MSKPNYTVRSPRLMLDGILNLAYFDEDPPAIPYHRVDGKGKLIVVVGDNASGKSFFRRIIQLWCQKAGDTECMHISVEGRRNVSYAPWLAFVYGDEAHESTGVNSAGTVLAGIRSCVGREKAHVIFWDEPDLGLGENWAAGIGQKICEFAQDIPAKTKAAFVVTHSRALVQQLLPAEPFFLHLGVEAEKAPQDLQAWLDRPIEPMDPELLQKRSRARFKKIQAILNRVQA